MVIGKEGGGGGGKSRHRDSGSERAHDLPKSHSILLGRKCGLEGSHSMPSQETVTLWPLDVLV